MKEVWPLLQPACRSLKRPAQRAFSAFSLSNSGVLEDCVWSDFSLLFGAVGLETKALIMASLRSSSNRRSLVDSLLVSHNPNPNCWVEDSKNSFSDAMIRDQNCSSLSVSLLRTSATFVSNDSQMLPTLEVNSPAVAAPSAITKVGFTRGVCAIASVNERSKIGSERILNVHLSAWAMITLNEPRQLRTTDEPRTRMNIWKHANWKDCNIEWKSWHIITHLEVINANGKTHEHASSQCRMVDPALVACTCLDRRSITEHPQHGPTEITNLQCERFNLLIICFHPENKRVKTNAWSAHQKQLRSNAPTRCNHSGTF